MTVRVFGQEDPDQLAVDEMYFQIVCFTKGKWRSLVYLRKVLGVLREHTELCENPNYQKLYNECIHFLLLEIKLRKTWTMYTTEEQQRFLEKQVDVENKTNPYEKLPTYEVDAYLAYRRYLWAEAERSTAANKGTGNQ